ncbi:MAG: hypothetical protein EOM54_13735 [Clostridia bacterium]|nr:hypothetical protein [Clostridia bacterium]
MPEISKRIIAVTGHYGSGKTEFSVSLAMLLAKTGRLGYKNISLVDLDIANPYFRSRERSDLLEKEGISVYAGAFKGEITAELPALDASIRAPLEDEDCLTIVDVGGNSSGARVMHQFEKYFLPENHVLLCVINANRPETGSLTGALGHLEAIECETGMSVHGIVNNCHLLMETTAETVMKGHAFCEKVCEAAGKMLWCDCYPAPLVRESALSGLAGGYIMPLGMYMRQSWLDK